MEPETTIPADPPTSPPQGGQPEVTARAIRGSFYTYGASAVTATLGLVRAVLLARLLFPADFGLMALATFYMGLAATLRSMGTSQAMVHHPNPDETTYGTYVSFRVGVAALSLLVMAAAVPLLVRSYPHMPGLGPLLWVLIAVELLRVVSYIQDSLLQRAMEFRGLATSNILSAVVMTVVAPGLAWAGFGVWSLVAEVVSGQLARVLYIRFVVPGIWPRVAWRRQTVRWFWRYGRRSWVGTNLLFVLEGFDDFWIGTTLGKGPLGLYSRAYDLAGYAQRVAGRPLLGAFFPAFARLQHDRLQLSRAFFRVAGFLLRVGVWLALVIILAGRELIPAVLGTQWMPMTLTLQIMAAYMALDPIGAAITNLLLATGHPGSLVRVRGLQVALFIPAVVVLSQWLGIAGVALATDLAAVTGTVALVAYARRLVDFSAPALCLSPAASAVATVVTLVLLQPLWAEVPLAVVAIGKLGVVTAVYAGGLWVLERRQLRLAWQELRAAAGGG